MKTLFAALFWASAASLFGQKNAVAGIVVDSSGQPLAFASAVLLSVEDSSLVAFSATGDDGRFSLKRVENGRFLLQISLLSFENHWQTVEVAGPLTLEKIVLRPSSMVLPTVGIRGERSPLRLSKDTIDYAAAAFPTQPGDVVEDLFRKMPTLEVQRDGTIKANGETVENVLVDGKEFFGKDTRIATKNLPADAIDRVQIFDRKSDMAEFSGIDDGQRSRTINLKLKEGKKHGFFGQIDAAAGTETDEKTARFSGKGNVHRFGPTDRLSVISMANNVNEQSFSVDEYLNFMGGIGAFGGRVEIGGDGAGGLPVGAVEQPGVQSSGAVGLNFSKTFSAKTEATASYFLSRFDNDLERESAGQQLLGDGFFDAESAEKRQSRSLGHRLNLTARSKIDSFSNLLFRGDASWNANDLASFSTEKAFSADRFLQNSSERDYATDGSGWSAGGVLTYRKKARKKGRSLSVAGGGRASEQGRDGFLEAENRFFPSPNSLDSAFRQRQKFSDSGNQFQFSAQATEPLGRRRFLEAHASSQNFSNAAAKDFFDVDGQNESPNAGLSNGFRRGYRFEKAGFRLLSSGEKWHLTVGFSGQQSTLAGRDERLGADFPLQRFRAFLPHFSGDYEFKTANRLTFQHETEMIEPTLEQLQPVVNNSDPLRVFVGNPGLRPELRRSLRAGYFLYDAFHFTSFFASFSGALTSEKIAESTRIDSLFRQISTPQNVGSERMGRLSMTFSTPIRPLKMAVKIKANASASSSPIFINEIENRARRGRFGAEMSFENRRKERFDGVLGARFSASSARFSEAKPVPNSASGSLDQTFSQRELFGEIDWRIAPRWAFSTEMEAVFYSKEAFGEAVAVPIWRAGLTHYFLKNRKGRLRLTAFDLLDRNRGVSRVSQNGFVGEERTRAIGRYFLVGFGYSISGFERKKDALEVKVGD